MIYTTLSLLVLAVVYVWVFSPLGTSDRVGITTAISMVALVILTSIYAWHTRKMAEEMKKQRHEAFRPIIDIVVQPLNPLELAKQAYAATEEKLPVEMPCILRNIGVGPAVDLDSFIQNPGTKKRLRFEFGTLAKGDSTPKMNLLLIQDGSNMILVAFYYDVYGNLLSSSRKVTINEQNNIVLDHLSIEPVMLVEE